MAVSAGELRSARGDQIAIDVRETRGLRRRSYPTSVLVRLPHAVARNAPFQLSCDGRSLTAQVRPASDDKLASSWWIDFLIDAAPHELRHCLLTYGKDVEPGPEIARGHDLRQTDSDFIIANPPYITWTVPRNLDGLIRSVRTPPIEYLRSGGDGSGPGLAIVDRHGTRHRLGGSAVTSEIVRNGKLAVALRFGGRFDDEPLKSVRYVVDVLFPSRVSWVEIACRIDDPHQAVAAIETGLNLALDAPTAERPTLVDLGASSLVYSALRAGERVRLKAIEPTWKVVRGGTADLQTVAVGGSAAGASQRAEGWAHVMDRRRCLALGVAEFGRAVGSDQIEVAADGNVMVRRIFNQIDDAHRRDSKSLRTWWHFIPFPPQQTAATSPQMMHSPLEIVVRPVGR